MALSDEQKNVMEGLGLPTEVDGLSDARLDAIEDALSDAMQRRGINDAGDGLNEYGEICRSIITALG